MTEDEAKKTYGSNEDKEKNNPTPLAVIERHILSHCFQGIGLTLNVLEEVKTEHLSSKLSQALYGLIKQTVEASRTINSIVLLQYAGDDEQLKRYITDVSLINKENLVPLDEAISVVHSEFKKKNLLALLKSAEKKALKGDRDVIDWLISQSLTGNFDNSESVILNSQEAVSTVHDQILEVTSGNIPLGMEFGVDLLDKYTGGAKRENLILLAARPGAGKTGFLSYLTENFAKNDYHGLFCSKEMGMFDLLVRDIGRITSLGHGRLQKNQPLTPEENNTLNEATENFGKLPITFDFSPTIKTENIRSRAKQLQLQGKLDYICLDYLQILDDTVGEREGEVQRISKIARSLKSIARDLHIPVIAACQLNREVEGRVENKPKLSDLRWSGQLEQEADIVVGLWKLAEEPNKTNFSILKCRNGKSGVDFQMGFYGEYMSFVNLDITHVPPDQVNEREADGKKNPRTNRNQTLKELKTQDAKDFLLEKTEFVDNSNELIGQDVLYESYMGYCREKKARNEWQIFVLFDFVKYMKDKRNITSDKKYIGIIFKK